MKSVFKRVACAALLFTPVITHAALISFDLTSNSLNFSQTLAYVENGLELTLTPEVTSNQDQVNDVQLFQDENGVGISLALVSGTDGSEVDALGPDEELVLLFGETVQLYSLTFGLVGTNDDFEIFNDNGLLIASDIPGGNSTDDDIGTYFFDVPFTGKTFTVRPGSAFAEFMLTGISVVTVTVPEPPLWLLLSSGLFFLARRSR